MSVGSLSAIDTALFVGDCMVQGPRVVERWCWTTSSSSISSISSRVLASSSLSVECYSRVICRRRKTRHPTRSNSRSYPYRFDDLSHTTLAPSRPCSRRLRPMSHVQFSRATLSCDKVAQHNCRCRCDIGLTSAPGFVTMLPPLRLGFRLAVPLLPTSCLWFINTLCNH